jgi:hypothetical protein
MGFRPAAWLLPGVFGARSNLPVHRLRAVFAATGNAERKVGSGAEAHKR